MINDPRFTDSKLNALRQAAVAGDWASVFSIAPTAWKDTNDPTEKAYFDYWNGNNASGKPLSLEYLRVIKQNDPASGEKIVKVPFTESQLLDYFANYHPSKPGYACTDEQIKKWTKRVLAGNMRYVFPVGIFCKPEKSSRRKKKLTKVLKVAAAVGVGVAGAVFLGPVVAGAAGKAGTALGVGSGTIAANTGTLVARLNDARTIKAIVDGKIPPPPIELSSQGFRDWAMSTAQDELMQKYQRKLTAQEENQLRAEIAAMQSELVKTTGARVPGNTRSELPLPLKRIQAIDKNKKSEIEKLIIPAVIVAGMFLLGG